MVERIKHPQKLEDRSGRPDSFDLSLVVLFEGWVEDLERLHASASRCLTGAWELVVVDNPVDDEASERIAGLERVTHIPLRDRLGFGAGRNLGLRLSGGRMVCVVDTSVELSGDVLAGLGARLGMPDVGLVGRWGVVTADGFSFSESDSSEPAGPDVDGVEAYLMAMRRADLEKIGFFDPKFRFYRNADIDYSFKVRDVGLRTIVDPGLPVVRHEHRLWEATPAAQREELSRKNFARFRRRWGDRPDLFTALDR